MPGYIVRRILATLPVMGIVAVIVFALLRLTPGDPASVIAGDLASPEQIETIRRRLGLNEPIPVQLLLWATQLLRGDLGESIISGVPVASMIADRLGPSLALGTGTILFSILVAVPLGVLAAWRRGTGLDRAVMAFSVLGFSVPVFVKGYVFILMFAIILTWLPVQGYAPPGTGLWPFLERLILPTVVLSMGYIALIARITRTSVLEVMNEDYIRTARAKGIKERAVLTRHALRNAAVPIVTIIGVGIGMLLSGVVVTESVFNLPGLGRLVVESVLAHDYPVVQGLILFFALVYILINLLVDVIYTLVDPRIRY
jgi:peptide/nickel transport system permease protein